MPAKSIPPSRLRLHGTVLGFNIGPRGHIEGALVETSDGTAQINFPQHEANLLSHAVQEGSSVDLDVELEAQTPGHRVYRLCDEEAEVSGQVKRLNHAPGGDVNGYHLDDATFVHVTRDGAKKYDLHVGETVRATGVTRRGPDFDVFEARAIERVQRLGKRHDDALPT